MGFQPGDTVANYHLLDKIGEGGMGVVWRAQDLRLGRQVALKVLPDVFARNPKRLARFQQEARLAASLNHPNIATIHGLDTVDGAPVLVMELVPGETVADRLRQRGPWEYHEALPLFQQIAAALAAAHDEGIIHRDLKPANVKVTPEGRVKILDFGLAKAYDEVDGMPSSDEAPTLTETPTRTGAVVGTANYMSPEQLRGHVLDPRSDLFQLGVLFFEMITGRHPFHGPTTVDVQHSILRGRPQVESALGKAPLEFLRVTDKLLEKERDYRYLDAHSVEVDLRTLWRDSSEVPLSATSALTPSRPARRAWIAGLVGLALLALVAGLLRWLPHGGQATASSVPDRLVPLTEAGGDNVAPSFSPDGNGVAFISDRGGQWDLWVTLVAGGDPVQITNTPEVENDPAWSPDGARIAFTRDRQTENASDIFVVPALGGVERKVIQGAYDPAWSPDGRWLTFAENVEGWSRIGKLDLDDPGTRIPLTPMEEGIFHRSPAWSPDGDWIVFNRSQGGASGRLVSIPSSGGSPVELIDDPQGVFTRDAAFTPDGRYVLHASDRGGSTNLWRVRFPRGSNPERITSGAGPDLDVDVSADGKRLAFSTRQFDSLVVAVSPAGEAAETLAVFEGGAAWSVSLSPDGSRVAFSRKATGRPWSLSVVRRGATRVEPVIDSPFDMLWPRFHPDGQSLIFFTWPGRQRVGRVNLDGTGLTWLTGPERDASYPDISPDGARLAFVRPGVVEDTEAIVVLSLSDGTERVVVENATLPCFSPDGRRLAFARSRSYSGGIGFLDLDGTGEPVWLTSSGTWPTWVKNGRAIAYGDTRGGSAQQAWAAPLDGGPRWRLGAYTWNGGHFPFAVDASGAIVSTDSHGGKATLWLAEYD